MTKNQAKLVALRIAAEFLEAEWQSGAMDDAIERHDEYRRSQRDVEKLRIAVRSVLLKMHYQIEQLEASDKL